MQFDTVFRGYDRSQVDNYLKATEERYEETMRAQRERIFSLVDENALLQEQLKQYRADEQAISKSLVESQKLAEEMKSDAEKFSRLTLKRAKIFHAAWQSYAQTILNAFSAEEVDQFNALAKKIENLISSYEGDVAATFASGIDASAAAPLQNPIEKVENASEAVIDLKEILSPQESLADLCAELGLISKNEAEQ